MLTFVQCRQSSTVDHLSVEHTGKRLFGLYRFRDELGRGYPSLICVVY